MAKVENAGKQHFSHHVFSSSKEKFQFFRVLFGKDLSLYHKIPTLNDSKKEGFGKGESAGNQHFLLFQQCFLHYKKEKSLFYQHLNCRLQKLSIWLHPKFCCLLKG